MTGPPAEFQEIADTWRPDEMRTTGQIDPWPAAALAAALGSEAPLPGEPLPVLWHEAYLHDAEPLSALASDGHPLGGLLPSLSKRHRMFGGGSIEVSSPLLVGEEVTRVSHIDDVRVREGRSGWLLLVTEEHQFLSNNALRIRDRRDIVYRNPEDSAKAVAGNKASETDADTGRWTRTIETDERLLFTYSALTYNAHRIHYDAAFARDVEGHPGLLVQGPLLATGCAEIAARHLGPVASMDYRLVSPAYVGKPVTFHANPPIGGECEVWAVQDQRVCARAKVRVTSQNLTMENHHA